MSSYEFHNFEMKAPCYAFASLLTQPTNSFRLGLFNVIFVFAFGGILVLPIIRPDGHRFLVAEQVQGLELFELQIIEISAPHTLRLTLQPVVQL